MDDQEFIKINVAGIPAQARVTRFVPARPMKITGPGFGDADPPEDAILEYELFDRKGYRAHWLESKADDKSLWDDIDTQVLESLRTHKHAC